MYTCIPCPLISSSYPLFQEIHTPAPLDKSGHRGRPWIGPALTRGDQWQTSGEEWSPRSRCWGPNTSLFTQVWLAGSRLHEQLSFIQFSGRTGNQENVIIYDHYAQSNSTRPKISISRVCHVYGDVACDATVFFQECKNSHFYKHEPQTIVKCLTAFH